MSRIVSKPSKHDTTQVQISPSAKSKKKKVLISFLSLDQDSWKVKMLDESFMKSFYPDCPLRRPESPNEIWRPSVALAQLFDLAKDYYPEGSQTPTAKGYEDLIFDEYYLLWDERKSHKSLKDEIVKAIEDVIDHNITKLHVENPKIENPFNTKDVYQKLFKYLSEDKFQMPDTQYYVNCTSGTTQIRNCLFYFTQTGLINALRIEPTPWLYHTQRERKKGENYPEDGKRWIKGSYVIDDPNLFGQAYATIDKTEDENDIVKTLQNGVITNDLSRLKKIGGVIECIKNIKYSEFKAKQTILITGETGVGKTQLARNIATAFGIKNKENFISVNCATIRGADPNIQRIELFGCKKGTTSEIKEDRDGALKKAHGGLLFLDEIGDLSSEMQAMLLTALDSRTFVPLGGNYATPETSSFQLICGTNRPLEKAVEAGTFRRDLYNRINAWHFELPPLREHLEDIQKNLKAVVTNTCDKCGRKLIMDPDAEKAFLEFSKTIPWDGNFRELNAMITRMVILSQNAGKITKAVVEEEIEAAIEHYKRKEATDTTSIDTVIETHSTIDRETYKSICEKLSPVKKAELDVLIKLIHEQNIKTQEEVCTIAYHNQLSNNGGLSKYLGRHFGLQFSHGRLERKQTRKKN